MPSYSQEEEAEVADVAHHPHHLAHRSSFLSCPSPAFHKSHRHNCRLFLAAEEAAVEVRALFT